MTMFLRNKARQKACVVIPVYKIDLYDYERASLAQCLKILNKYDIYIITYKSIQIKTLISSFTFSNNKLFVEYFEESFFTNGINGYNKLLLNINFYNRFSSYEYMLIYQLDAYVFKDELEYWCNKGYDYIGAPWVDENTKEFKGVGNGGFSLRKISYSISVLSRRLPLIKPNFKCGSIRRIIFDIIGIHNNVKYYTSQDHLPNEDGFFSVFLKNAYNAPIIPDAEEASLFSLEKAPSYLFVKNGQILPFGCHAFNRNEFDEFWSNYIKIM